MSINRTLQLIALATTALFVGGYACGEATESVGDALRDVGMALFDVGAAMSDAGDAMSPDASAQTPPDPSQVFTVVSDGDSGGDVVNCDGSEERVLVRGPALITYLSDAGAPRVVRANGAGPCEDLGQTFEVNRTWGTAIYIDSDHVVVTWSGNDVVITGRQL